MRVRYPGPMLSIIVGDIEIKRGEEGDLTQEQFKRVEAMGVERVDTPLESKETKKESGE